MSYTYAISPSAMFEDRFEQFVTLGIPRADVSSMRDTITDMWADAPNGWVYEWSRLAQRYMAAGQSFLASLAYGCAKFPCLANEARRTALAHQVETYLAAASGFPVKFERRLIEVPFAAATVSLPVHLYSENGRYSEGPVLLLNGGVDTWKIDLHGMCVALAQKLDVTVVAFDQPGTGENPVPLVVEADEIVLGLVKEARKIGNGRVAHFGTSFGANYSAMTGLTGVVDCAIVLGGPVDKAFAKEALANLPYGMPGIIGNDMGFDRQPTEVEFADALGKFSRRTLLDRATNAPMLVINGADDYFVPQSDTRVFEGRPQTETHLLGATGHCAFSKLPEVMGLVFRWLPQQIA
jgi:esterase FrsA